MTRVKRFLTALTLLLVVALPSFAQAPPKAKKLTKEDVVKMVQAGIPESIIISRIKSSGTVFRLETADIIALHKAHVPEKVLTAMLDSEMEQGRPPETPPPTPAPREAPAGQSEEEKILGVTAPTSQPQDTTVWGAGGGPCTIQQAAAFYRDQRWPEASDALFCALEENKVPANDRPDAQQHLADSLYNMGLYQSALYYYLDALHGGTTTRAFASSLEKVVLLSDKLRDDRSLIKELQDIPAPAIPAELRRDAGYFYGMLYFRKGDMDNAKRALHAVSKDSPYYGRAKYTEGVILSTEEPPDNKGAVDAFREAINAGGARAPASKVEAGDNRPDVVEQEARLAVARVLYGAERYRDAVEYFRKITEGPLWADSLFDNGWALFKNKDFGYALGNVLSTRSPFFEAYYEPEGMVLESIVYYRLCLFPQANNTINNFIKVYSPYSAKIKSFRKQAAVRPPEQVFAFLKDFVNSPKGRAATFMPYDLMLTVASDGKISDILFHLRAIEYEENRIRDIGPWRQSRVASALIDEMNGHKDSLQKLGGKLIVREFEDQDDKLDNLFAQVKTIRFEITNGETNAIEKSLTGGSVKGIHGETEEAAIVIPDNSYYWPFQGEYWKDEIGYYQFAVKDQCVK